MHCEVIKSNCAVRSSSAWLALNGAIMSIFLLTRKFKLNGIGAIQDTLFNPKELTVTTAFHSFAA